MPDQNTIVAVDAVVVSIYQSVCKRLKLRQIHGTNVFGRGLFYAHVDGVCGLELDVSFGTTSADSKALHRKLYYLSTAHG